MPLSPPSSPTVGQTYTANGRTWTWTGAAWELAASAGAADSRWDLFLPAAPTGLTATAGNAQASLSWAAPTGVIAQAPITDYVVQFSSNSGSSWTTFSDGTSTLTSATVTGLTNSTAYVFRVAAVNAVGVGTYSTASSAVTPVVGTPPGAPTGLTAAAGNAQISLAWTAPSSPGTSAITGYTVEYTPSGGSAQTVSTGSTSTTYTLTGLTNETAYTVRIAAVSAVGAGSFTAQSSAVTPTASDPFFSSVTMLLHADGSGSTFVDSSLSQNQTLAAFGGATQSATEAKWGGKSAYFNGGASRLEASGAGLAFGTGDFVVEFWMYYTGTASQYNIFDTRVSGGNGFLLYKSSEEDRLRIFAGGPILTSGSVSQDAWHHIAIARNSGTLRLYVDGSQSGASYSSSEDFTDEGFVLGRYTVAYIDDLRITKGSSRLYTGATIPVPTAAFPDGPMSAPTSLAATAGNAQVSLTWTAPAYNGGSAITDYSVQFSSNSGSTWTTFSRTASTTASQVVSGLTNGTAYVFRVAGINGNGTGTYTAASSSATPSSASLTVSPATLTSNGGSLGGGTVFTWSGAGTVGNKLTTGGTLRQGRFGTGGSSGQVGFRIPEFTCGVSGTLFFEWGSEDDGEGGDYYGGLTQYRKNGNLSTSFATSQVDSNAMSTRGISVSAGDIIRLHSFVAAEPFTPLRAWIQ